MLTTSKHLQANNIFQYVHQVLGNKLCTSANKANDLSDLDITEEFVDDASWTVCSTYHSVLWFMSGVTIYFKMNMLFDICYIADWKVTKATTLQYQM